MNILVIEQDAAQRELLQTVFEKAGLNGVFLSSGEKGLEQLALRNFDLAVLSLNSPENNTPYTLKKMREIQNARETPVLVYGEKPSHEMLVQCNLHKISEYLVKPASAEQLLQKFKLLKRILLIAKDVPAKKAFANVGVESAAGITRFTFVGQFSLYSVLQFYNLYTPLLRAQTENDTVILNVSSVPHFGAAQAEPLHFIGELLEPKQGLIIGGRNFGPLMPMVPNVQSRVFIDEVDAMNFIKLQEGKKV